MQNTRIYQEAPRHEDKEEDYKIIEIFLDQLPRYKWGNLEEKAHDHIITKGTNSAQQKRTQGEEEASKLHEGEPVVQRSDTYIGLYTNPFKMVRNWSFCEE
eukprot:snap_masked-scaffold_3-processed-gene-20.3-mRNA-1 protein AED:1.00 eAED:1.00 QI:0/0/0/0/1/1/3/0/100